MKRLPVLFLLVLGCGADRIAPTVSQTLPPDGYTNIVRNTAITVYFSEAMDEAATAAALSVSPPVAGAVSWFASRNLSFTPATPLDSFTEYTVTVGAGARDLAGNALASPFSFRFTTGASVRLATLLHLFGRSVLEAWFYHWGWDGEAATPVSRSRFKMFHHYLAGPEGDGVNTIADFRAQVNEFSVADSPVVFFKLCFIDFAGGDSAEAQANLARNTRLVDSLAAIVAGRGLRLIVGNALPKTESEHDAWLGWNHLRYNAHLAALAQANPGRVFVLDLYGTLTDPATGCIRHQYRTGESDAHPNAAGYWALDPVYDALLHGHF